MKKTRILPLLAVALLCNCGGSDDKEPGAGEGNGSITVVGIAWQNRIRSARR